MHIRDSSPFGFYTYRDIIISSSHFWFLSWKYTRDDSIFVYRSTELSYTLTFRWNELWFSLSSLGFPWLLNSLLLTNFGLQHWVRWIPLNYSYWHYADSCTDHHCRAILPGSSNDNKPCYWFVGSPKKWNSLKLFSLPFCWFSRLRIVPTEAPSVDHRSQNQRITDWLSLAGTYGDLLVQPPAQHKVYVEQFAQGCIQLSFKYPLGWGLHSLSGQLLPVLYTLTVKRGC